MSDPSQNKTSEHEGKLFIAQKGKAICDKGTSFPQFKVTSHDKLYINDGEGQNDYLAVTEDDLSFNPIAMPFGNCSLQNGKPCTYAPAGKWKKFYKDTKVMGHCLLTEISELQCAVGGKIKILNHGQRSGITKTDVKKTESKTHQSVNPFVNMQHFKETVDEKQLDAY